MEKHIRWFDAIPLCRAAGKAWAIATIIGTQGSTPRAAGSKMLITADKIYDTLGGGQLEYYITLSAREMINQGKTQQKIEYLPLSSKTKQCCGGTVNVLFECFAAQENNIYIFGAGHVATALVKILGEIDCQVHWVDNRPEIFPSELPANTQICLTDQPVNYIQTIKQQAYALVLTHDHSLDYLIVKALLDYGNCTFIGLIGSQSKALRFKQRLKSESFSQRDIDSVHCPVGLKQVGGKYPMEVAVSIAGQLIQLMAQQRKDQQDQQVQHQHNSKQSGIYWRDASEQAPEFTKQITDPST